jgi:hypothetical protein
VCNGDRSINCWVHSFAAQKVPLCEKDSTGKPVPAFRGCGLGGDGLTPTAVWRKGARPEYCDFIRSYNGVCMNLISIHYMRLATTIFLLQYEIWIKS